MSIEQIGKNSVNEFFEEITFGLGNSFDVISNLPDSDNDIINEAIQSGISVMKMGILMLIIQQQEQYLEKILNFLFSGIALTLSGFGGHLKRVLSRFTGIKAIKRFNIFGNSYSDRVAVSRLGAELILDKVSINSSLNTSTDRYKTSLLAKSQITQSENHRLNLAQAKTENYTNTLLFKLFAQGFTPKDKVIIKRILGKDVGANIDIEELNKVANFMYIKDSNGNVTGLSEAFMDLLNGLGYLHNKK